ncbi:MAG: hypothetical protein ACREMT_11855, partial [Vulcanimicrobiaceae bacterium]
AIQVLDKTNPRAVITAWEEEPEETPIVRRRLETSRSGINYLDSAVLSHCGYSRSFEMERIVDPDRPVQRSLVRYFTRLGYVGAFIGPLFGGENPVAGFAISGVAALLLAWRALPVLRELARVGSKLRARPAEEIEAWRYRFRAALAEACVRVVFVILPIVGSIASAMIEPQ